MTRRRGEVLAASRHELLLSWPEVDGVLGLKAFRAGADRAIALDWSSWGSADHVAEVESWLAEATDRLGARVAEVV